MDHARSDDPAVQAQLDRFAQLSSGRDILGLERITALLHVLGDPQRMLPPVLHVAGTNGKGSTCAFLRAGLEAEGRRVHVYTSPHLVRFNERIRLAGRLIEDVALAPLLAEVLDAAEAQGVAPSFFEVTTAAALLAFARTPADACVIEVGLGGRLDATNVVMPGVCGIAQIGLDHQAFLGDTLAQIATEKAGIAKPGVPLVCLAQPPEALQAIAAVAGSIGAPLLLEGRDWTLDQASEPALMGPHQRRNAGLAAEMLRRFGIPRQTVLQGIAQATWPARLQKLDFGPFVRDREVWIDGAHNPQAAEALAAELSGRPPLHLVLGILANKDAAGILAPLAPLAASLTFVPVPGHVHHDPQVLSRAWGGRAIPNLSTAINASPTLIAGSLYLCGEALRLNEQYPD